MYSVKMGLLIGLAGAVLASILALLSILKSSSLFAPTEIVFIPALFLIAFLGFFIFGCCVGYIRVWLSKFPRVLNVRIIFASIIVIWAVGSFAKDVVLVFLTSQINSTHSSEFLAKKFNDSYFKNNKFVLGAIAQNHATSPEILDKIAKLNDPELHKKINLINPISPLFWNNNESFSVMVFVIRNPNTLAQTIEYLASTSHNKHTLRYIAINSKTSIGTLRRLELKKNDLIDLSLSFNKNTPADLFPKLLERAQNKFLLMGLLNNSSVPSEVKDKASAMLADYPKYSTH